MKWSFHLRPAVRFHDGKELTSKDVVASLIRSAELPLFSHLRQVTAQGSLTVVIELSQPDPQLPLLLTDTAALILPADHASRKDFAVRPIGSGPYFVAENDQWQLRMQAFDDYFGFRGLLDDIEVIVWPLSEQGEAAPPAEATARLHPVAPAAWPSSSLSHIEYTSGMAAGLSGPPDDDSGSMSPENGGYFLLCERLLPDWSTAGPVRRVREVS